MKKYLSFYTYFSHKLLVRIIIIAIAVWVAINFLTMYWLGDKASRYPLYLANLFFMMMAFIKPRFNKFFGLGLLSLNLCDLLFINYETDINYNGVVFFRTLGFILISYTLLPKLKKIKFNFFQIVLFLVVIGVNVYLLNELENMLPVFSVAYLKKILFYFYAMVINMAVGIALYYNNIKGNQKSFYFLNAILWMLFSDISYFVAYDLGFVNFYYVDRFFNVFGLGFLCLFAITPYRKTFKSL